MRAECTKVVTGTQMAAIDRAAIDDHGIPGIELMERAGSRVVETIRSQWDGLEGLEIAVVCGKGNNGGDGFVIARLLHQAGVPVCAFFTCEPAALTPDAAHHHALLVSSGASVREFPRGNAADVLAGCDLVVDCLLGTGLRGAARDDAAGIIRSINDSGRPVVCVDMPSGVEADSGKVLGASVKAAVTVTFGLPKIGQLFHPGRSRCGMLHLVEIGFPKEVLEAAPAAGFLISEATAAGLIPRRRENAHKGDCGSVVVVAGSAGMTGAAALTAMTALKTGAGRVTAAIPESLNDVLEIKLTEPMTCPLPEVKRRRCLSLRALGGIGRIAARANALAVGPGLGIHPETAELVRRVLAREDLPAVVDADGLNALVGCSNIYGATAWQRDSRPNRVLTPHLGEFCRLTGMSKQEVAGDPIAKVNRFAKECGAVVLLKGAPTCVGFPDGNTYVCPSGNAGMATAGSGDVLTGLIAGLIAQGLSVEEAACCGAFLHGRAGDIARDRIGEWGMVAGDIQDAVPEAILGVFRNNTGVSHRPGPG